MNTKQNAEFELLDALERIVHYYDLSKTWSSLPSLTVQAKSEHENTMFGAARAAIKKFREQPVKQSQLADASLEPVAWHHHGCEGECIACLIEREVQSAFGNQGLNYLQRHINTTPKREWKGLTDAQIGAVAADIWGSVLIAPQSYQAFARAIEAAHGIKGDA